MAKILVIDDEPGIRNLLDVLLSRKGYEVVLADHGTKGLELFRREHPDAVVLDLKMPEMSGITVLQHLRRADQKLPVIVLTGAGTPETEQQAYALGVTEFIEKEFSLHRLGDSLKRHFNNPSTAR
jgi:DNA-binding NtrC family response regulator